MNRGDKQTSICCLLLVDLRFEIVIEQGWRARPLNNRVGLLSKECALINSILNYYFAEGPGANSGSSFFTLPAAVDSGLSYCTVLLAVLFLLASSILLSWRTKNDFLQLLVVYCTVTLQQNRRSISLEHDDGDCGIIIITSSSSSATTRRRHHVLSCLDGGAAGWKRCDDG